MDTKAENEILNNWLLDTKKALLDNYIALGLKASGKWGESLQEFSEPIGLGVRIGIKGEDYTEYMQNGRRPNKDQTPEALRKWVGWFGANVFKDWVEDKGLDIDPYSVAWKVAREGIEVPTIYNKGGLVSDVVNTKRINELGESLSTYYINDYRSTIRKILIKK